MKKHLYNTSIFKKLITLVMILVLLLSTGTGILAKDTEDYMEEIEALRELILNNYSGGEITEKELFEAALEGMTSVLDDYSIFYNDVEAKVFIESLSSQYVGIGVRIQLISNQVVITEVFEGGAAKEAGIRANDVISKVNDEEADQFDLNQLVSKIVGEEGTYVNIEFIRERKSFSHDLERRSIIVPTVVPIDLNTVGYELEDTLKAKIYGIKVTSFMDQTDEAFIEAVEEAKMAEVEYLLIDMRDNSGGYLNTAVTMLQQVVPKGEIVTLTSKNGVDTTYTSELEEVPFQVVLLVNENSASASEIFSAAVKENGDGIVIGESTYGKGVAQNIYHIGEDYLAKLTTQEFFSPELNKINGVGVIPDIIIDTPEYVYSDRRFYSSDVDEQIVNVEGMLKFMGYFNEEPDDTYTISTYYAVKEFQRVTGLYPYGVCDFTTQGRLNTEYTKAVENNDIQLNAALDWIVEDTQN